MTATLTTPTTQVITFSDLVLLRYSIPKATPKVIKDDIGKLLRNESLADSEFAEIRDDLVSSGFLTKKGRSFTLTNAGLNRALQLLGVSEFPSPFNWTVVVAKHLFPKAMGMSVDEAAKMKTGDQLAAFILKQKYGLNGATSSTATSVKKVIEAIVCKEVGFPEESTLDGLSEAVLFKMAGFGRRLPKKDVLKQLPLFETGLKKAAAADARNKIVRDWLATAPTPTREVPTESKEAVQSLESIPVEPFDLAAFASTVKALALGSPPEERFHDNKAFIAPLWRASQKESNFPRMSLAEFKQRLLEANAQQLLHLSRADQVQEMDPQLVNESETTHLNATFHFVLLEGDRQ